MTEMQAHGGYADRRGHISLGGVERDREDEACDTSVDSFPASDPPSWTGLHIGGPARPRPPSTLDRQEASGDGHARVAHGGSSRDGEWLARRWPGVHVRVAELLSCEADGVEKPTLSAVVQLGTLTPADVRGAVVFEATAGSTDPGTTDLLVTVWPAPRLLGGGPLPSVVGLVRWTARTDRGS